jgi:hypothetical protein
MYARESDFGLTHLIERGVRALGLQHRNKQDIRSELNDQNMNCVDHWITHNNPEPLHILIKTKWSQKTRHPEVAQYISCVDRIQSRIESGQRTHLLWASKTQPTHQARAILTERRAEIMCCNVSIEMLARNVITWIAETCELDPAPGLREIPLRRVSRLYYADVDADVPVDETPEGQAIIAEFQMYLQSLHQSVGHRIQSALNQLGNYELQTVVHSMFPMTVEEWYNGSHSKVEYNRLLRTLAKLCVPTRAKHYPSRSLLFYCKMRRLSIEFASHMAEFHRRRATLMNSGLAYARSVSHPNCMPEPMTQEEYGGHVVHCDDYWVSISRNGVIERVPSGIQSHFYNYYNTN